MCDMSNKPNSVYCTRSNMHETQMSNWQPHRKVTVELQPVCLSCGSSPHKLHMFGTLMRRIALLSSVTIHLLISV